MENILITEKSSDYELIDSGGGEKLERYGQFILSRPEPQAIWTKASEIEWKRAHAVYKREGQLGKWEIKNMPETWEFSLENFKFTLKLLPSKHLGVFPEQSSHWKWLEGKINKEKRKISVLNLFAYTGGSTMACARAGASVVHLDASKFVVEAAGKNLKDSKLGDKTVRFIVDDVRKFVEREIKRKNKYDVILLDPPIYGKGAKKEVWKIEEDLLPLLSRVKQLLSKSPVALILNGYSSVYSHIAYRQILSSMTANLSGKLSSGELAIKESAVGRLLPAGIFAKWEN